MSQSGKVTDAAGGGGADTFVTDSGSAVEVAGVINILGTAPLTTSGAGNTVTIEDDGTLATTFITDSGSAVPSSNAIGMSGGTGLNTSGAGAVVTTNLDSPVVVANGGSGRQVAVANTVIVGGTSTTNPHQSVASVGTLGQVLTSNAGEGLPSFEDGTSLDDLEFVTNDGNAFPSSDVINVVGSGGISGAGGGNTITFSLNSPILLTTGGTGRNSSTAFSVICGGVTSTDPQQSVASVGSSGDVLTSNGAGALPTFQAAGGGGGMWSFVSSVVASSDATIEFINLNTSTAYKVVILNLRPANDNTDLFVRMSDDNGSTFAAVDYQYTATNQETTGFFGIVDNTSSEITINVTGIGTAAGEFGLNGEMNFWSMNTASEPAFCTWHFVYMSLNGGNTVRASGVGCSADDGNGGSTQDIDAIQFFMSSGNIATATFHLYELVTS